jgi:hypothetical protein
VPILIEFLETKVDVKLFESPRKSIISRAVFQALEHYGTQEALDAIAARQEGYL